MLTIQFGKKKKKKCNQLSYQMRTTLTEADCSLMENLGQFHSKSDGTLWTLMSLMVSCYISVPSELWFQCNLSQWQGHYFSIHLSAWLSVCQYPEVIWKKKILLQISNILNPFSTPIVGLWHSRLVKVWNTAVNFTTCLDAACPLIKAASALK